MKKIKKEFWIGFRNAEYFISKLLKKDFGHCYVIGKDQFNWVEIDPRNGSLEVTILPYELNQDVPKIINEQKKHKFIHIELEQEIKEWPNLNPFRMIHCVNIVKYILGIHIWAVTPYKFYRKLLKMKQEQLDKKGILKIELIS